MKNKTIKLDILQQSSSICKTCKGWINPSWTRGDGDYRHCDCNSQIKRPTR